MNTVALAQLLARNLAVEDSANLSDDAVLDILSAINTGLSDFYQLAAPIYRTTSISVTLRAPETVSIEFAERYSAAVVSPTFPTRQIGCSVRIDGYALDTRIASGVAVLDDWLGDDLTQNATIFHDAIALNGTIERLAGAVTIRGFRVKEPVELMPSAMRPRSNGSASRPDTYWIEPIGINQGGQTASLMRVWPYPDTDYLLAFDAVLSGARTIILPDLIDATEVPVAEKYAASILLPMCEGALTASGLWREKATKSAVLNRADEARQKLSLLPPTLNPGWHRCMRPVGF